MVDDANRVVVQLIGDTSDLTGKSNAAARSFDRSMSTIEAAASRAEGAIRTSHHSMAESANGAAGAQMILNSVIRRTTDQIAAGAPVATIFAEHIGALAEAAEFAGGSLGGVGAFLAGPWGIALSAAASVAAILAQRLFETGDAAHEADDGLKAFQHRQADIGSFIDATTGKLIHQNEVLVQNAMLTRGESIRKNSQHIVDLRDKAFGAVSKASVTGERFTAERQPGEKTFDVDLVNAISGANGSVIRLNKNMTELAKRRPDLKGLADQVNNLAAQAASSAEASAKARGEMVELQTAVRGGTVLTAGLVEQQVHLATARTAVARAQEHLNEVERRGREIDRMNAGDEKNRALEQFRRDLTDATIAVQQAQDAQKSAAETHREHARAARESAKAIRDNAKEERELESSLRSLRAELDPLSSAWEHYLSTLDQIAKLQASGKLDAATAGQYRRAAVKKEIETNIADTNKEDKAARDNAFKDIYGGPSLYVGAPDKLPTRESEDAVRNSILGDPKVISEQQRQIQSLANFYERAFEGGTHGIWDAFKRDGERAVAYALAKFTLTQAGSLFGKKGASSGGGISSFLGDIAMAFGRASGGYVGPGSLHRVNEGSGGVELLKMGSQGGKIIPLGETKAASRGGGVTVLQSINVDSRGAVMNDEFASLILTRAGQHAQQISAAYSGVAVRAAPGAVQRTQTLGTPP